MVLLPGRATYELGVSMAASAVVALMVLAGGTALEAMPDEGLGASVAPRADQQSPLVICRDDRHGFRCIPEES